MCASSSSQQSHILSVVSVKRKRQNQWIMLSNVVDVIIGRICIIETRETSVRHVFLIFSPRDTTSFEDIDDRRNLSGNVMERIIAHAEVVTARYSDIVGLRGMSDCVVVGEKNSLRGDELEIRIVSSFIVILELVEIGQAYTVFSSQIW